MFSDKAKAYAVGIIGFILVAACIVLGALCYGYVNKVHALDTEIAKLRDDNTALATTIKQNDVISSSVINSLNESLTQCQTQQNDIIEFCDKRVRLALESKDTEITPEACKSVNENAIIGIDSNSSRNYVNELNSIFNTRR